MKQLKLPNYSKQKKTELDDLYKTHRKKAKVVFLKDSLTASKLGVTGTLNKAYVAWLDTVTKFHTIAAADVDIQTKLELFKVTLEDINKGVTLIDEVKAARAEYLREKGESEDATKAKDAAFSTLADWMSEFYAVAKIALEDNPQLLEALGVTVRS